jgi:peptidoglycan/LPS O-acetylase OafA/YrhL
MAMGTLRFLLALAVAAAHAAGTFGFAAAGILDGSRCVQMFYVISGFLIALILDRKYENTAKGVWLFYSNRALRIFVPYLVILFATIGLCLIFRAATGDAILLSPFFAEADRITAGTWLFAAISNLFLFGTEWAYMLVYRAGTLLFDLQAYSHPPMATMFVIDLPAWSLSIELTFYLLAPFILRRHWLWIATLACALQWLRTWAYHHGFYSTATDYRFFPFELSLFLLGALAYRARARLTASPRWSIAITAAVAALILYTPRYLFVHQYQLYVLMALALPTLLRFTNEHRWDRWLAELSYPVYVVHWPVLGVAADSQAAPTVWHGRPPASSSPSSSPSRCTTNLSCR